MVSFSTDLLKVSQSMGKADVEMIRELGEQISRFAGASIAEKVIEGSHEITEKTSKRRIAGWVKGVMERLDTLVDEKSRIKIMENCGHNCAEVNRKVIDR